MESKGKQMTHPCTTHHICDCLERRMKALEKVVEAAIRCRNENIKGIEAIIGAEAWAVDDLDEALRELHK